MLEIRCDDPVGILQCLPSAVCTPRWQGALAQNLIKCRDRLVDVDQEPSLHVRLLPTDYERGETSTGTLPGELKRDVSSLVIDEICTITVQPSK